MAASAGSIGASGRLARLWSRKWPGYGGTAGQTFPQPGGMSGKTLKVQVNFGR